MKKLVSTRGMSREQWLEWRRRGIGGSDAAALIGLSPWATPFSVYADKIGLLPEREDNEAMRQGRDLEEYVARRFCEETGKRVRCCNAIIQHEQHDFLLANVDRLVVCEDAGLECKTMNPRSPAAARLEDGDVPVQYYVQCQHYMAVTGYSKWYLAILVLGVGFYWFEIPREASDIHRLVGAETQFWNEHIVPRVPPAPDASERCEEVLKQLYPRAAGTEVALPRHEQDLQRLADIKTAQAALEAERRGIENSIRADMKDAEIGHANGYTVTLRNCTRSSYDTKAAMRDHPEIDWEQYQKTTEYRTLAVKEDT